MTCLTNIIRENEDKTWTIVSANDETQMGLDHGWHYETITFLRKLEKMDKDTKVIIPTKNVYFFIEKIPLDYSVVYSGSGQSISKKGKSESAKCRWNFHVSGRRKMDPYVQNVLLGTGIYGKISK